MHIAVNDLVFVNEVRQLLLDELLNQLLHAVHGVDRAEAIKRVTGLHALLQRDHTGCLERLGEGGASDHGVEQVGNTDGNKLWNLLKYKSIELVITAGFATFRLL